MDGAVIHYSSGIWHLYWRHEFLMSLVPPFLSSRHCRIGGGVPSRVSSGGARECGAECGRYSGTRVRNSIFM
ncbi:hypothetical protein E2C01_100373 [Portunus trituberculatus]|uniref:Uncharacterized protein n=1 Tax=Portunus trituberculatus TaxID=210409 RepID=A0A5B7K7W1_PORTR|nr:hypothetical protein [Portunus trituberculatus]